MTARYFCDKCGCDLPVKSPQRIKGEHNGLMVEVLTGVSPTWNSGHLCHQCIVAAVTAVGIPQPHPLHPATFRLPDGELACYRRDAAKLREAGATVLTTSGAGSNAAHLDRNYPNQIMRVEFPPTPKTEPVPWWEAGGRQVFADDRWIEATGVGRNVGGLPYFKHGAGGFRVFPEFHNGVTADGTVEVLLTDDEA